MGNNNFLSPVLNQAWGLALGFNLWMIWKEQNNRIFKNKISTQEKVCEGLVNNIRETILVEQWSLEDGQVPPHEARILLCLNLSREMVTPNAWKAKKNNIESPKQFTLLGEGFIKLNFDGALKGNPRITRLGGIFRDNQADTRLVYVEPCGIASNNEAKFTTARHGLRIAVRLGYKQVEVEGGSNLVINTLRKLNNGMPWDKLSKSWRTARLIQEIRELTQKLDYLVMKHVRREGNKATDFLVNKGCNQQHGSMERLWPIQSRYE